MPQGRNFKFFLLSNSICTTGSFMWHIYITGFLESMAIGYLDQHNNKSDMQWSSELSFKAQNYY